MTFPMEFPMKIALPGFHTLGQRTAMIKREGVR